jgi:hypothetical protein
MQNAQCELRLTIWREAKWRFEGTGNEKAGKAEIPGDRGTQDACRRYEALYGRSCAEFGRSDSVRAVADGPERMTSATRLTAIINHAIDLFAEECHQSIMLDRLPGEVQCGHGEETIGVAWDRILTEVGLPQAERQRIANELNLDNQARFALLGLARKEAIDYLLASLRELAGQAK